MNRLHILNNLSHRLNYKNFDIVSKSILNNTQIEKSINITLRREN